MTRVILMDYYIKLFLFCQTKIAILAISCGLHDNLLLCPAVAEKA